MITDELPGPGQITRSFGELVDNLFRDNDFPAGVFLMTGTGIVPGDDGSPAASSSSCPRSAASACSSTSPAAQAV